MNMQQRFSKNSLALLLPLVMLALPFSASADEVVPCNFGEQVERVNRWYCGVTVKDINRTIRIVENDTVQNVKATQMVSCQDDICAKLNNNQYLGSAPNGLYLIPYNYYLGPAENGTTVAYPAGQGPGFEGEMHSGEFGGGGAELNTCVAEKIAAFREENGEEALIIAALLEEWKSECQ